MAISLGILTQHFQTNPYKAIFCGDIPANIGLKNRPTIYGIGTSNESVPESWPLFNAVQPQNGGFPKPFLGTPKMDVFLLGKIHL